MRRLLLFFLLSAISCSLVPAQSPPAACPPNFNALPAPFCGEACIVCDLDGYYSANQWFPQWDVPPQFCAPQFHSVNWVGFVAGTTSIVLNINTFNCQIGSGLQAEIYRTVDCTAWQSVSNCDPGFNSTTLHASGLQPGETYFVVIDGNGGDICDFRIDVVSGSAIAPDVEGTPQIDGPADFCQGGAALYTANNVTGAAAYTWTLNGNTIGYEQSLTLGNLPAGTYQLCVEPSNPCYGPGESACRDITASPLPTEVLFEEVCVKDLPFIYQGISFFNSGSYSLSYTRPDGCEQPVLLHLTVLGPNPPTVVNADICLGEAYSLGNRFFTQTGYYPVVLTDQNGCDSLIELILIVHPPSLTNLGVVPAELPFLAGGIAVDTTGPFKILLADQNGCDSIVAGLLVAIAPDTLFIDSTICQGETVFYNMNTLASSGIYLDTLINATQDTATIQQLTLTVLPVSNTTLNVSLCQGEEIVVGGLAYSSTGQYQNILIAANGCDSIITLNLAVLQPTDTILATICEGEAYPWNSSDYTLAGLFCDTIAGGSASGCDSIACLELVVLPVDSTTLNESICAGESFSVGNSAYSMPGQYIEILPAASGCDSVVTLNLMVTPVPDTTFDIQICEGSSFNIGGQVLEMTGAYRFTFPNPQTGCDSIVTINLTVLPTFFTQLDEGICEGESYSFGGAELSQPGVYQEVFVASNGCDSMVVLHLTVSPVVEVALDTALCPGQSLALGPYIFREPFEAELQFTGAGGCDSIINLTLTYYDTLRVGTALIEPDEGDFFGGSIAVEMTGGTPPYSFLWSNGRTEPSIDLLATGQYFLIVTDANDCQEGFYFKVPTDNELGFTPPIRRPGSGGGNMQVSPNPFSEEFLVQISGLEDGLQIRLLLYNFAGQLVHEEQAPGLRHRLRPGVPAGVYWLVAEQKGIRTGAERVVKTGEIGY